MNILLVNGSPKGERSNTLRLANAFFEGICYAQKDCLPKIERLNIAQMDINSCLGCFSCWKTTPGKCCIYDDMQIVNFEDRATPARTFSHTLTGK